MAQKATSKTTSINSKRLPAAFSKINLHQYYRVVDYGCGRYTDHIRAAMPDGVEYLPYDPYNQPETVNAATLETCADGRSALVVLSNVLNVIDDWETVAAVCRHALLLSGRFGNVAITVYEGDRSGVGRYTGADSFQRNLTLAEWEWELSRRGFYCCRERGVIWLFGGKDCRK